MNDNAKTKSVRTAFLLWLPPLGLFGAHRLYTKRIDIGILLFVVTSAWLILTVVLYAFIGEIANTEPVGDLYADVWIPLILGSGWAVQGIWWLIDGFLIRDTIDKHNYLESTVGDTSTARDSDRDAKRCRVASLLWLPPLGLLGAHRFYPGQRRAALWVCLALGLASLIVALWWGLRLSSLPDWFLHLYPWALAMLLATLLWWITDSPWITAITTRRNQKQPDGSFDSPSIPQRTDSGGTTKSTKSTRTAHLLWLPPLGWLGIHRIYTGRWSGFVLLGGWIIWSLGLGWFLWGLSQDPWAGLVLAIPWLTFSIFVLTPLLFWWIRDGYITDTMVEEHNAKETLLRLIDEKSSSQKNETS